MSDFCDDLVITFIPPGIQLCPGEPVTILAIAADMVQDTDYLKLHSLDSDETIIHVDIIRKSSSAEFWHLEEKHIREIRNHSSRSGMPMNFGPGIIAVIIRAIFLKNW